MSEVPASPRRVRLYDGVHPIMRQAVLYAFDDHLEVRRLTSGARFVYPLDELSVSPRIARSPRFIALPDGQELECADEPWLDRLPQQERTEGPIAWLEQRWWVSLAAVVATLLGVGYLYLHGIDRIADRIAQHVSPSAERQFGEAVLRSLDAETLQPTRLAAAQRAAIARRFEQIAATAPLAIQPLLYFRYAKAIGPNAFALAGGVIVVTDQLVQALPDDDTVVAVLAHELGHVEGRHFLRMTIADSSSAALAALLAGDLSSVAAGSGTTTLLLQNEYSQKIESEADAYAVWLLRRADLSPELFARALQSLHKSSAGEISLLSTHPPISERIARARAAARLTAGSAPR